MARAAVAIRVESVAPPSILVGYTVGVDTGLVFGGIVPISFTQTAVQMLTTIQAAISAEIIAKGGPSLLTTDFVVVGIPT